MHSSSGGRLRLPTKSPDQLMECASHGVLPTQTPLRIGTAGGKPCTVEPLRRPQLKSVSGEMTRQQLEVWMGRIPFKRYGADVRELRRLAVNIHMSRL